MCRTTVLRELQLVTIAARADVDRDPMTDLWPGILSKVASAKAEALNKPIRVGSFQPIEGGPMRDRALARSPTGKSPSASRSWHWLRLY